MGVRGALTDTTTLRCVWGASSLRPAPDRNSHVGQKVRGRLVMVGDARECRAATLHVRGL